MEIILLSLFTGKGKKDDAAEQPTPAPAEEEQKG